MRQAIILEDDSSHSLSPGGKMLIPAGMKHQIINTGIEPSRYLVVQYGGAYDFIAK
jgi:mannose-6-phosphate isomerase-like protein (cupin superfamily)